MPKKTFIDCKKREECVFQKVFLFELLLACTRTRKFVKFPVIWLSGKYDGFQSRVAILTIT